MLSKQRRSSQRLASVLEAMTSDLDDFNTTEVSTETEEDIVGAGMAEDLADYAEQDLDWKDLTEEEQMQMIGDEEEVEEELEEDEEIEEDLEDLEDEVEEDDEEIKEELDDIEEEVEEKEAAIEDEIGNQTVSGGPGGDRSLSLEKQTVGEGNVEFEKEDEYEESIRNVVNARKARVASIVAKLDNIADRLERQGNKKVAYRIDLVSDRLEKEYLN